jgi:hypothetical protein
MKVQCPGPGCADRRRHHEDDTPRGPQMVEVESAGQLAFCSLECAIYAGVIDQGGERPRDEWKIEWPPKDAESVQ